MTYNARNRYRTFEHQLTSGLVYRRVNFEQYGNAFNAKVLQQATSILMIKSLSLFT